MNWVILQIQKDYIGNGISNTLISTAFTLLNNGDLQYNDGRITSSLAPTAIDHLTNKGYVDEFDLVERDGNDDAMPYDRNDTMFALSLDDELTTSEDGLIDQDFEEDVNGDIMPKVLITDGGTFV